MASRGVKTTPAVTCLKLLLSVFTIILWVIGVGLLAGGIYIKIELQSYQLLSEINISSSPYVVIGIGVFVMLIGFFGCYSITKGNTCMLRTFGFTLGLLFVAEVALALVVIVYRSKVHQSFIDGTEFAIEHYDEEKYKTSLDEAQSMLHCCGSFNYSDYWMLDVKDGEKDVVPKSCCINTTMCHDVIVNNDWVNLTDVTPEKFIYIQGCPAKFFNAVDKNLGIILGVLFGVAGFQLIGLILSCCLASNINANKYELV